MREVFLLHTSIMQICISYAMLKYIILETICRRAAKLAQNAFPVQIYTVLTVREIYDQLEARRAELRLSQAEVGAIAFGKSSNSAFQALRRGSAPSADKLAALCDALGLELYFGPPRDNASVPAANAADYVQVPMHDAVLAAGNGTLNDDEQVIGHLAFRRDWFTRHGISASRVALARVTGASMARTISDGDMVMIDTSRRNLHIEHRPSRRLAPIYAILDDGHARVKRLTKPTENLVTLSSDNPDFPVEHRELHDLRIIGKVVWWAHTVKE